MSTYYDLYSTGVTNNYQGGLCSIHVPVTTNSETFSSRIINTCDFPTGEHSGAECSASVTARFRPAQVSLSRSALKVCE